MTRLTGNHVRLFQKITAGGLACLLLVAGLPLPAVAAEICKGWKTAKFFESATVDEVRACLSAGEDPNEPDTQGLTALHRAARETGDPAVIEALLNVGTNPRTYSIAGRLPWDYARRNDRIKGSAAYQQLRMAIPSEAKKADWSRVQAMPHNRKTQVRLYQDAAPRRGRRIKGRFDSVTADSITLRLKDGQTRTLQKQAVHKVLIPRPFLKRKPGWATLAVTSVLTALWMSTATGAEPGEVPGISSFMIGTPTIIAFLVAKMGTIYDVPPNHRPLPQGEKQSGASDDASGKQVDPRHGQD